MIDPADTFERRRAATRRRTTTIFAAGLAFIALVIGTVVVIVADFEGAFSSYVAIRANLPAGQPVNASSEVQYQQVPVGQVGRVTRTFPDGSIQVMLRIKPDKVGQIPANVTAQVAPSSIFGTEAVMLSAPGPSPGHLRPGVVVAAAGSSSSLQGTLSDLNHLLTGLHPAQIDATLGALSTALQGQGPAAGGAIRVFNSYIDGLIPNLPTLEGDINLVTPVLNGLSASVPALLDIAQSSGAVATTLSDDQRLIAELLANGSTLTTTASALFSGVQATLHSFLVNLAPILADINGRPGVLADSLTALDTLAKSFLPAFTSSASPSIDVAVSQYTNNPELALLAGSNLPFSPQQITQMAHAAFAAIMDPATYSAADCPRYGAEAGPNCPGSQPAAKAATPGPAAATPPAGSASATPSAGSASATPSAAFGSSPELTAPQQAAINDLMTSINGRPPAQPGIGDTLLGPLLQSLIP